MEADQYNGLTEKQVKISRFHHGSNAMETQEDQALWRILKGIVLEPIFILLFIACAVYFFVGQAMEGVIMLVAIFIVRSISIFQEYRSRNAIQALKK